MASKRKSKAKAAKVAAKKNGGEKHADITATYNAFAKEHAKLIKEHGLNIKVHTSHFITKPHGHKMFAKAKQQVAAVQRSGSRKRKSHDQAAAAA
jgi:hypothetical protein